MKRSKLAAWVLAVSTGGVALQFSGCSSDVANLIIDAANRSSQVLATALIDAFFFSLGDSTISGV